MTPLNLCRRRIAALFMLASAGFFAAGASAAQAVDGLIVQLRDAPTHEALARAHALSADAAGVAESARWQRVLRDSGLDGSRAGLPQMAGRRATGLSAQVLQFERPLGAAQAEALAQRLRERADVAWVVPNRREHRLQVPTDPFYASDVSDPNEQWWLHPVSGSDANVLSARLRGVPGFQAAWQRSTGVPAVAAARIAVLDTGITPHAELAGHVLAGYDFVSDTNFSNDGNGRDADPTDPGDWVDSADRAKSAFADCAVERSSWHGTLIAGVLAAASNNGQGVAGINWGGQVVPVRVAGKCGAAVSDIIDGMRWAAGLHVSGVPDNPNQARIVNVSFGGEGACNAAYQQAIDELHAAGAVVVAAAGNDHAALTRPANCSGVIGVAALNRDGFKATYSNFGAQVVLATVGGDDGEGAWGRALGAASLADSGLLTIYNDGQTTQGADSYASLFGTSFSTPLVSGAISLMLSVNPALTADQIVAGLRASARPHVQSPVAGQCSNANPGRCICTTATCGAGVLDADQAVRYAEELAAGRPYVAPNWPAVVLDSAELRAAVSTGPDRPANPVPTPAPADPAVGSSTGSGGAGGGAMSPAWLLALAGAAAWLRRAQRAVAQV
jgi:serine protease